MIVTIQLPPTENSPPLGGRIADALPHGEGVGSVGGGPECLPVIALLLFLPAGAAAANFGGAEGTYHESLAAFKLGRYRQALEGFMDVLIDEPDNPEARARMRETAQELLRIERLDVERERENTLAEIHQLNTGLSELREKKRSETQAWKALMEAALKLAQDPGTIEQAVIAYETAVSRFPVYSTEAMALARARADFQGRLAAAFPQLGLEPARGPKVYTGQFLRLLWHAKEISEQVGLYVLRPESSDKTRDERAETIDRLEMRKELAVELSEKAFSRYKAGVYDEAAALWRQALGSEAHNPQARYYLKRLPQPAQEPAALIAPTPKASPDQNRPARLGQRSLMDHAVPRIREARPALAKRNMTAQLPPASVGGAMSPDTAPLPAPVLAPLPSAQELYQRGLKAYSLGDLAGAIRQWKACLEADLQHPKARKALERALREAGE